MRCSNTPASTLVRQATMIVEPSRLSFRDAPSGPIEVKVVPLTHCFIALGTGYGMDADWRHGMYQGPLVVLGKEWSMKEHASWGGSAWSTKFSSQDGT